MPAGNTQWANQQMLAAFYSPDTFVPITSAQLALCLAMPVRTATVDLIQEVTAPEYTRATLPMSAATWVGTGFGELTNRNDIVYPTVTSDTWGGVVAWALLDPVSGNCMNVGSLDNPNEPLVGQTVRIFAGTLVIGIYDSE